MFAGNTSVVSVIGALNESVNCLIELSFNGQFLFFKKACWILRRNHIGCRQTGLLFNSSLNFKFLTFACLVSTGMIVMKTFGMHNKIADFSQSLMAYLFYF